MNENAKNVYENMIDNGITPLNAREAVVELFGEDPTELQAATVRVQVTIEVELDSGALEDLTEDDEADIITVATMKVENELSDTYGDMDINVGWGDIISLEKG